MNINFGTQLLEPLEKVDYLSELAQRGTFTPVITQQGWTATLTGSGASSSGLGTCQVATGATASSTALRYIVAYNLDSGSGNLARINWDKALRMWFRVARTTTESETTAFVQLKEATTIGQLAAKGIGITVANLAVSGESYGTQRNTTSLSTTLTTAVTVACEIRHYPASRIEWWINGVLKGTESTAANIPSGNAGGTATILESIANGVSGGTSALLDMGHIWIWQAN